MTVEELMKPRYKAVADYPKSIHPVGEIIQYDYDKDGTLGNWPHLFKPLEWWEDRKPEDIPKYIKSIFNDKSIIVRELIAVTPDGFKAVAKDSRKGYRICYHDRWLPATEQEYLSYIESLKQST